MLPHRQRFSSKYQVNFAQRLWTTMLATNQADIALALHKATEGFTPIVDQPTDTDIIDICQLFFPVLMQAKYDELTLTHNLSGFILTIYRYKHIYGKVEYSILPVVALYE